MIKYLFITEINKDIWFVIFERPCDFPISAVLVHPVPGTIPPFLLPAKVDAYQTSLDQGDS